MTLSRGNTRRVWRVVPEREAVTLRVRTSETAFTDYSLAQAKKNPVDKSLVGGDAALRQALCEWVLWDDQLDAAGVPAASPKVGDVVRQADGTDWAVEAVNLNLFDNERGCRCRRLLSGVT